MNKFENINQYRSYFTGLIQEERRAEMDFHRNEISLLSGRQREEKGRAILLLNGRDAGFGIGGSYLVKLVRGEGLPNNEISVGDIVIISKNNPTGDEPQATVIEKTLRSLTVAFSQTPPHYVFQQNLRLDLFSNDVTFQRMLEATNALENEVHFHPILLQKPLDDLPEFTLQLSEKIQLNESQKNAVESAINTPDIFLIHGPPGTGKTTAMVSIIKELSLAKKKLLVTASSNTAVDNLVERLWRENISTVRVGNPARVQENLLALNLDTQLQDEEKYQEAVGVWDHIDALKLEQNEQVPASGKNRRGLSDGKILQLAEGKKNYRGIPSGKLRKMAKWIKLQRQINQLYDKANQLQQQAIEMILDKKQVVCTTNSTAGSELLKDYMFDYACIDEATQTTEPESLIPMVKSQKVIMAGDHKQLPPTVKSDKAQALKYSLFERLMESYSLKRSHMLSIQYRMHEDIMRFSNEHFYHNKLKAHPSNAHHTLADLAGFDALPLPEGEALNVISPLKPVVFIPVEGQEKQLKGAFSYYNKEEITKVKEALDLLLASRLFPDDIGIISPYDQQVNQLKQLLSDYQVEIKSIDGFQGREKEVIILSLVRANTAGKLGFLTDYRRLNVALTRAKRKLIVIANAQTLETNTLYKALISDLTDNK